MRQSTNNDFRRAGMKSTFQPTRYGQSAQQSQSFAQQNTSQGFHFVFDDSATATTHVPLLDPLCNGGKVRVPLQFVLPSRGFEEYQHDQLSATGEAKELSLCCLFHLQKCSSATKCHQIHVDRDWVNRKREEMKGAVSCCRACGDAGSVSAAPTDVFGTIAALGVHHITMDSDATLRAPLERVAYTLGLLNHLNAASWAINRTAGVLVLPARKICRLHLRKQCKYGKDCKNIHICNDVCADWSTHNATPTRQAELPKYSPTPISGERFTQPNQSFTNTQSAERFVAADFKSTPSKFQSSPASSRRGSTNTPLRPATDSIDEPMGLSAATSRTTSPQTAHNGVSPLVLYEMEGAARRSTTDSIHIPSDCPSSPSNLHALSVDSLAVEGIVKVAIDEQRRLNNLERCLSYSNGNSPAPRGSWPMMISPIAPKAKLTSEDPMWLQSLFQSPMLRL